MRKVQFTLYAFFAGFWFNATLVNVTGRFWTPTWKESLLFATGFLAITVIDARRVHVQD